MPQGPIALSVEEAMRRLRQPPAPQAGVQDALSQMLGLMVPPPDAPRGPIPSGDPSQPYDNPVQAFIEGLADPFSEPTAQPGNWLDRLALGGGALLGMGMVPLTRPKMLLQAVKEAAGARGATSAARRIDDPIHVYHGSPHDFDEFSMSKIGTGEGAQAYGHGLYFAENEGVARTYRDTIGRTPRDVEIGEHTFPRWVIDSLENAPDIQAEANSLRAMFQRRVDEASAAVASKEGQWWVAETNIPNLQQITDGLGKVAEGKITAPFPPRGRTYEVALHARPEEFLDWDAPLSQQSEQIRQAVRRAYGDVRPVRKPDGRYAVTIVSGDQSGRIMYAIDEATPEDAMKAFDQLSLSGSDVYHDLVRFADTDPSSASLALGDAGIPGLRYFDAGSRRGQEGTRNYVVWQEEIIELLRKFGILPPLGAMVAGSQFGGEGRE